MKTLLPLLLLALSHTAFADGVDRLKTFAAGVKSAEANFAQTVTDRAGRVTQKASGTMAFSRPGKFRWDYAAPYAQHIVGDGQKLWWHDPDLEQVTVKPLGDVITSTPAALLAGDDAIEQHFTLRADGTAKGLEWLVATPKQREAGFERIRMGFRGDTLEVMQLADHFGQTTTLVFSRFVRNPKLAPATFRFVMPAGADLIGE